MNRLLKLFGILVVTFSLVVQVHAQDASPSPAPEPADEVSDLQFPINELDGCTNYKDCLTYCDDPVNNAACIDYAKKKGFYKDDPVLAPTDDFLTKAKDILGCESATACASFCGEETNYEKCNEFAKSQGVLGGYVEGIENNSVIFDDTPNVLGCSDPQSCQSFCADQANKAICDKFADDEGLLGGEVAVGPGGCTTEETCQAYCSDPAHFEGCQNFVGEGNFTGPGGCDSPESCRNYCEENYKECRSYAPGSNGVYVPVSCPTGQYFGPGGVCTRTEDTQQAISCSQGGGYWNGNGCIVNFNELPPGIHPNVGGAYFQPRPEMGGCSTPGTCFDFCKENAGKCPSFQEGSGRPKDDYIPSLYYTPGSEVKFAPKAEMGNCSSPGSCYDFCKENPGKCGGFDSKSPRPVDTYMPGTYYTPPSDYTYFTPPATSFYVTPIYYTPPAGSSYTTPTYYTPGMYSTPTYYTPFSGSNYTTPTYYTPGSYYSTPTGSYPTPNYLTPTYYTPPTLAAYNTPTYYTPYQYTTPTYYTPPAGSNYTTPTYHTPPAYTTPQYYTPYTGGTYTTPTYYTPPAGSNYTTPTYPSPSYYYPTPTGSYTTPTYPTPPAGSTYTSPTYYTPGGSYYTPSGSYSYPTPSSYSYPTPSTYYTPGYSYPSPESYPTPSYSTPSYGTPEYGTPSYGTPESYSYPTPVQGASTKRNLLEQIWYFLTSN